MLGGSEGADIATRGTDEAQRVLEPQAKDNLTCRLVSHCSRSRDRRLDYGSN
jgi:hypothetical protein